MPSPEQPRVFISYARKDGASLAQRLQEDLKEQGFDAWLDTQRVGGGAVWSMLVPGEDPLTLGPLYGPILKIDHDGRIA